MSRKKSYNRIGLTVAPFLTLVLAAWWVIFPVLPQLHLAFAGHRHYFCQDHQRYEDLIPDGESDSTPSSGTVPEFSRGLQESIRNPHLYCSLSNLTVHNQAIGSELAFYAAVARDQDLAPVWSGSSSHSRSILSQAPKHSPPLLTG